MEVGDRVRHATCGAGSIIYVTMNGENRKLRYLLVEFDNKLKFDAGHSGDGKGKDGYCYWFFPEELNVETCNSIW